MSYPKITELPPNTSPLTTDVLPIYDIGTSADQKITIANLLTLFVTNVVVQTLVATGTYTPTTGMKKCLAILVGGGGGGGAGYLTDAAGSGGGGGGCAIKLFTAANIGANKAFTIGAAGGGSSNANAAAGGDTFIGAAGSEILKATGGGAGTDGRAFATYGAFDMVAGGGGGIGSLGDLNMQGSPGEKGVIFTGANGWGGAGGCSFLGMSGLQPAVNVAGTVGTGYGSGGGGGHASAVTDKNGAAGKIGVIYIIEFLG
jgi:hypothetical protein